MAEPIFFDTEGCGLHSPSVLLQYSEGYSTPILHNMWTTPFKDTIDLIEWMCYHSGGVIAFNLVFDWFHLQHIHALFSHAISSGIDENDEPQDHIPELAEMEADARDCLCIKPVTSHDIMLHARKGPYQSMMKRKDITIRRIPTKLAYRLAQELEERIKFKDIYFAKRKTHGPIWKLRDCKFADDTIDPDFKDVYVEFQPSSALKSLYADAFNLKASSTVFKEIALDDGLFPLELGYAPFASAIYKLDQNPKPNSPKWKHHWRYPYHGTWPFFIQEHIDHWAYNQGARRYAANDVTYLQELYKFFGCPEMGDDDSLLSTAVGSIRWHGYSINTALVQQLLDETLKKARSVPTAPKDALRYLFSAMDDEEKIAFGHSTKKTLVEEVAEWEIQCECGALIGEELKPQPQQQTKDLTEEQQPEEIETNSVLVPIYKFKEDCQRCGGSGKRKHDAAPLAQAIVDARSAGKQADVYKKTLVAGRLHAAFKILGAKSSRMSGDADLNTQGIPKLDFIRVCFNLAFPHMVLCGGDYDAFEVGIAEAVYADPELRRELLSGRKIHAIFGTFLFPGETYESILASSGKVYDMYKKSKSGLFAWLFAGNAKTLHTRLGIPEDQADKGIRAFEQRYPKVGIRRAEIMRAFSPLRQPKGMGSNVEWHTPRRTIATMFGFERYFDLEYQVCEALFHLAQNPPKQWKELTFKVQRDRMDRERIQTPTGATQSALFGAAFGVQGACARAAVNHEIQGTGGGVTKGLQVALYKHQPVGVHEFVVMPMNVHDELMCPTKPEYVDIVAQTVEEYNERLREKIPLLKMKWRKGMKNWGSKEKDDVWPS